MAPVAVVTDTTHYLPRELVAANDLHQVSLYVHWGGRDDRESDLPDFDAYYEHLRPARALPTTSRAPRASAPRRPGPGWGTWPPPRSRCGPRAVTWCPSTWRPACPAPMSRRC